MLTSLTYKNDFRCFTAGEIFEFRPLTLLVGNQGSGKSSLIHCIRDYIRYQDSKVFNNHGKKYIDITHSGLTQVLSFDFEKDNRRTSGAKIEQLQDFALLTASHGEVVNATLKSVMKDDIPHTTFIMDEPDMALSIRSIVELARLFKKMVDNGHQIIASVHNPLLIQAFPECYNLGVREWQTPKEFFNYMGVELY